MVFPLSRRHSSCLFCQFLDDLPSLNPGYTTSLRMSWVDKWLQIWMWDVSGTLITGIKGFLWQKRKQSTYKVYEYGGNAFAWSPDGRCIASGSWENTVKVWDVVTGATLHAYTYEGRTLPVHAIAWSPNGRYIAFGGEDSRIHIWDKFIDKEIFTYTEQENHVHAIVWSPDSKHLAIGYQKGEVQVKSLLLST